MRLTVVLDEALQVLLAEHLQAPFEGRPVLVRECHARVGHRWVDQTANGNTGDTLGDVPVYRQTRIYIHIRRLN